MKLTPRQLRRIIIQELRNIVLPEALELDSESPESIIQLIDGAEEADLIYYGVDNLKRMIQVLKAHKVEVQEEHDRLNNQYKGNEVLRDDPFWYDEHVYPLYMELADIDHSVETLQSALVSSGDIFPEEGLTDDDMMEYQHVIDDVDEAYLDTLGMSEEEMMRSMKAALEQGGAPEELWSSIINYVMEQYQ